MLILEAGGNGQSKELKNKNVFVVLNKSDMGIKIDETKFANAVKISAKLGDGVDFLVEKIRQNLGVADFDIQKTVCFTPRQRELVGQIAGVSEKKHIANITGELLNGSICV